MDGIFKKPLENNDQDRANSYRNEVRIWRWRQQKTDKIYMIDYQNCFLS